jgi:hypothetical protein
MIALQERLATILSLASQLRELDQLQERVRKAELVRRSRGSQKKNGPLAKRSAGPLLITSDPGRPARIEAASAGAPSVVGRTAG